MRQPIVSKFDFDIVSGQCFCFFHEEKNRKKAKMANGHESKKDQASLVVQIINLPIKLQRRRLELPSCIMSYFVSQNTSFH